MKKSLRGFTLVECIIALAILGIASAVMVQIYAYVGKMNLINHSVNTSLSYQMKIVEKATGTDSIPIYYGSTSATPVADNHSASKSGDCNPPSKVTDVSTQKNYIEIKKYDSAGSLTGEMYSYPVDIYVLLSRDKNDEPSKIYDATQNKWVDNDDYQDSKKGGFDEKDISLRYKYIVGHKN